MAGNGVIVSKANKLLVIPRTGTTATLFPGAHQMTHLNADKLVVPHGTREFMLLKKVGYRVPNPLLSYYNWCNGTPFSVQKSTCALLTSNTRAYVLNDMGTGKTRAALWAWDYLHGNGYAGKLLVVAPLSTLNFVWARECFATLPHRKVGILHGSRTKRLEVLNDKSVDIYVINHDGLRTIFNELYARTDIDVLVLDELAKYRNNSDRSKLMRKFALRFTWAWGMTGRPMPQAPTDVWMQCMILTPGMNNLPRFKRHAEDALMTRLSQFVLVPKKDAIETAFSWMQPAVRFDMDSVKELPETVYRTVDIPMSHEQSKIYTKMLRECQALIQQKVITAMNAGVAMNKLLQIAGGWVYTQAPAYVSMDNQLRVDTLLDLLDAAERKVIVYVPYRHAIEELSKIFRERKDAIDHASVHGDTLPGDRDKIFHLFQNTDKIKVLLAHPGCTAHGLTLTAADTVIWWLPLASLETYEQANARIIRVGQKHRQQIIHLQSSPIEAKTYRLLQRKQKVQDQYLSLFEDATGAAP